MIIDRTKLSKVSKLFQQLLSLELLRHKQAQGFYSAFCRQIITQVCSLWCAKTQFCDTWKLCSRWKERSQEQLASLKLWVFVFSHMVSHKVRAFSI